MAHVFTLEATNHLVPRWFSEGVSVYEEWSTGPLPGRHIPLTVFQAIKEKKFLPIAELDRGFIHPTYEAQVIVSYMQAGLICEYIAKRWGQQGLRSMLDQYGAGKDTAGAVEAALDLKPEQFDEDFAGYVDEQFGSVVAVLDVWRETQKGASEARHGEDWEDAVTKAAHAINLFPDYVDEGSAYLAKAKAERELERNDDAIATLLEYRRRGGYDPDGLMQLAKWLEEAERPKTRSTCSRTCCSSRRCEPRCIKSSATGCSRPDARPTPSSSTRRCSRCSRTIWPRRISASPRRTTRLDDRSRCREHLLYALEIAPNYREAQQLLLEIVR